MPAPIKASLRESYDRLKKSFEKLLSPKKEQYLPPLALQPYRPEKRLRGTNLR